mmetsp:Transcript_47874/g.124263  ORF Transcript_47874/g.124263 Transcript_47874/m.124263 type:complete len:388 (-) Transcript_47874:832-1995(-)
MTAVYDALFKLVQEKTCTVGIMGLGYVGLPLAHTFHQAGYKVMGFDVDQRKIDALRAGEAYLAHLKPEIYSELKDSERFEATTDFARLSVPDAVIICVPTPVGEHFEPDLTYVMACAQACRKTLRKGQLVVLESTTYPGTTDEDILGCLKETGLELGKDYFLAYSPEREDPGNKNFSTKTIPKLLGGVDEQSGIVAEALYKAAFNQIYRVSHARVAESAKLVENIYRAMNIALVNELKMVFEKLNIDVWEVLDAASTKPFGFQRFNPGPGWGGHCIPVDPFYLVWKARAVGMESHFIQRAGEINVQMPQFVVDHVIKGLNRSKKALNGSKVLMLGLAYKPNIDDVRESPAFPIWELLLENGAEVEFSDAHVDEVPYMREHATFAGRK